MTILASIAEGAQKRNLEFLLAGGHAVIAHGYARNTFDLDLIIRRNDRVAWTEVARNLGYQPYREGPTFLQFNPDNPIFLPLDLMLVNDDTFAKLVADSVPAPGGARVVSLLHLLALKCHAIKHGHPGRVEKDVDDVLHLVQLNRLDVNEPNVRALVLKHGPPELYEKLQRVCKPY